MGPNPDTITEEILNGKLHFCAVGNVVMNAFCNFADAISYWTFKLSTWRKGYTISLKY